MKNKGDGSHCLEGGMPYGSSTVQSSRGARPVENNDSRPYLRREFLWQFGGGLGGVALAQLLAEQGLLAAGEPSAKVHHPAKAKRVVQLFMSGAASQCDTFDYKPELIADHGKKWDPGERVELFQSSPGQTLASPWPWRRYGQCGKWVNDCVAPLGQVVDDLAFV